MRAESFCRPWVLVTNSQRIPRDASKQRLLSIAWVIQNTNAKPMAMATKNLLENITQACKRIKPHIRHTPLEYSPWLSESGKASVYIKLGNVTKLLDPIFSIVLKVIQNQKKYSDWSSETFQNSVREGAFFWKSDSLKPILFYQVWHNTVV